MRCADDPRQVAERCTCPPGAQMDTSTQPVPKRRFRTIEEKQRILAEATAPGASVALVARKHGVNANLVFGWMRLRKAGLLGTASEPAALLPVEVGTPTVLPDRATRPAPASQVATWPSSFPAASSFASTAR